MWTHVQHFWNGNKCGRIMQWEDGLNDTHRQTHQAQCDWYGLNIQGSFMHGMHYKLKKSMHKTVREYATKWIIAGAACITFLVSN